MKQDERDEVVRQALWQDASSALPPSLDLWPTIRAAAKWRGERVKLTGRERLRSRLVGALVLAALLTVPVSFALSPLFGRNTHPISGASEYAYDYYVPAATVPPTALPAFPPQSELVDVLNNYYATFNDTNTLASAQDRYNRMYSLMLPSKNPCDKERFVTMLLAIKARIGVYYMVDIGRIVRLLKKDMVTGEQLGATTTTVTVKVSTVSGRGDQVFTLVRVKEGWLISRITDTANGPDYDWPPKADAPWQQQVACIGG